MPKLTGSHVLLRSLKLEGVDTIFTIVGDTILPLVDACADEGMRLVDTRHEAAAMHMADGWARITGRPGVVLVTGGPGFANAISALPNIYTSESPVVLLTGSAELPEKGMYAFQEIDQVGLASPVTKGSWLIHDASRIPDMAATAFRTALSGRPGPVCLTMPIDIQEQERSEEDLPKYGPSSYRSPGKPQGDPYMVKQAVELLANAKRPVVVAANAARYSLNPSTLRDFIEHLGIPVFTVEQARGMISDDHPLCFGYGDAALNAAARRFRESDVVVLLGKRLDHRYRYGSPPYFSAEAKIIQVDPSPDEIGKNRGVSLGIQGDIGAVVTQMLAEAQAQGAKAGDISPWLEQLESDAHGWREHLDSFNGDETPLHPISVYSEVEPLIGEDDVIIIDGGDYVQWGRCYLKARKLGHWMRLGPLSQLGCGLPYALGAKLARPQSNVFLFMGDGSIGFYLMEYDTAVRFNLNITTVLGNDSTWGIDKNFQLAYYGRAVNTDLRYVAYEQLVSTLGGHGETVSRREEIAPALGRALGSGKPSLLNVVIGSHQSPLADAMVARKTAQRS